MIIAQNAEKIADTRHEVTSISRGSVEKQAQLKTVSPSGEKRETMTTAKFERHSPDVTSAGNINAAAAAAAAAAALSHQRMMMSPLPFDRVSVHIALFGNSIYHFAVTSIVNATNLRSLQFS